MYEDHYKYALQLQRNDGEHLAEESVEPDFEPLVESVYFGGIRRGVLPADRSKGSCVIEPVWHDGEGMPTVGSVRASVMCGDVVVASEEAPTTFFYQIAQDLSAPLVANGTLKAGEVFTYRVKAQPNGASHHPGPSSAALRFEVEEVVPVLPVRNACQDTLVRRSRPSGIQTAGDMPVFILPQVLAQIEAATRKADWNETGGLLIGHLARDRSRNDLVAIVTAQLPAEHTRSEATRLGFTPDTWAALDAALTRRHSNEIRLGWWHCHSFWRENHKVCEKKEKCPMLPGFFSEDDVMVQRTVFPRAYSVGLLATYVPCGRLQHTLFAWRNGMVTSRGFRILGNEQDKTSQGE
jgi:hypothetical protein